jgi:hypothetical protein
MFGWFRPTCPCDPAAKRWVEDSLLWLSRQFGLHILLERPVILPTSEFFPDHWDGTPKAGQKMFSRVCSYMNVDPDSVTLEFFNDPTPQALHRLDPSLGFAAGTWSGPEEAWQKGTIRLEKGAVSRPADLVGTMAHELAHQKLLGERRTSRDRFDNELLTDLTAVFHGFGVFLANNPRKSTGELSRWPGTKLYRPEYLSEPMTGYAMAHIAWFRNERSPVWAKALRWAPHSVFKQGVRYLFETSDSTFRPVRLNVVKDEVD